MVVALDVVAVEPLETFADRLRTFHRAQILEEETAYCRLGLDGYLSWWAENRD